MIIGVVGKARHGKDTIAAYLEQNYRFIRVGLADPMKRICKEVFKFNDEQLYGNKRDEPDIRYQRNAYGNLTPRYALQTLGTEWGRNCYQDVWIDYGILVAKVLENGYARYTVQEGLVETEKDVGELGGVVFSDLRFKNEVDAVRKAGGIVWRVVRPGCPLEVNGVAGHVSEVEQDGIPDSDLDCVLHNDEEGNLSFLYRQVDEAMEALQKGTA